MKVFSPGGVKSSAANCDISWALSEPTPSCKQRVILLAAIPLALISVYFGGNGVDFCELGLLLPSI